MTDGSVARVRVAPDALAPGWLARLREHLLVLRFALFNIVAVGLLAATWARGWLDGALTGETLWLVAIITTVFLYGLAICARQVVTLNRALNAVRAGEPASGSGAADYLAAVSGHAPDARMLHASLLRLRLSQRIGIVRHVANALVLLGLVGTVIGFIIALSAVDPELTASVDKVAPMVSTLINGMSIALYTTLIGALLHLWLMIGYRMLATGGVQLFHAIVDLGERHVGR